MREKEAQYVPPPAHLAQPHTAVLSSSPQPQHGFKSPERMRVPHDDRAVAGRALSPLRETPMHRPGTVIHSGWLYRKGMMNNWKKKWFTIIGSSIYYADTKVRRRVTLRCFFCCLLNNSV